MRLSWFERKNSKGKFTSNLKASNGQVVGASEQYESGQPCLNGIKWVSKNAMGAKIEFLVDVDGILVAVVALPVLPGPAGIRVLLPLHVRIVPGIALALLLMDHLQQRAECLPVHDAVQPEQRVAQFLQLR